MFGDFEAQRHWMEITANLPIKDWYSYKLEYWGLDYPPLSAFHAFVCGKIGSFVNHSYFELDESRGLETSGLKLLMRISSIITDYLILVPSVLAYQNWQIDYKLLMFLITPALNLIDHGHFQYNSAMLGFALLSFHLLLKGKFIPGSIAFCSSLLFKQMSLFYALPVFVYILSNCLIDFYHKGLILLTRFLRLLKVALTVIATFMIILLPFIVNRTVLNVFTRVFPMSRGLFEDKVANFWFVLSIIVKVRKIFDISTLAKLRYIILIRALSTVMASLPSLYLLFKNPNSKNFKQSLFICSLNFFLFGFQVHEKSILLPLFAVNMLLDTNKAFVIWFNNISLFSLWPLLRKDGLEIPYFACLLIYNAISMLSYGVGEVLTENESPSKRRLSLRRSNRKTDNTVAENESYFIIKICCKFGKHITMITYSGMILLHVLEIFVEQPAKLPHFFIVLNQLYSFLMLTGSLMMVNFEQFQATKLKID